MYYVKLHGVVKVDNPDRVVKWAGWTQPTLVWWTNTYKWVERGRPTLFMNCQN